jgi:hypothetical protein
LSCNALLQDRGECFFTVLPLWLFFSCSLV